MKNYYTTVNINYKKNRKNYLNYDVKKHRTNARDCKQQSCFLGLALESTQNLSDGFPPIVPRFQSAMQECGNALQHTA